MNTIVRCLLALAKSVACGFLAAAVPIAVVLIYLFVEIAFLDQPADGNDSHIRSAAGILLFFPFLWAAASLWFVLLGLFEKRSFRRTLTLTMLPTLILPIHLGYLSADAQAPVSSVLVGTILGVAIGVLSAALSSWGWVRLHATWPD